MPKARRMVAIGVLALAGALVAAPAAGAKARGIPAGGTVTLGSVRCEASEACLVKAPKQVGAQVHGATVRGRVLVPSFLGAGAKAKVKVHFGAAAMNRLAGAAATFRAKIVVRGSGKSST